MAKGLLMGDACCGARESARREPAERDRVDDFDATRDLMGTKVQCGRGGPGKPGRAREGNLVRKARSGWIGQGLALILLLLLLLPSSSSVYGLELPAEPRLLTPANGTRFSSMVPVPLSWQAPPATQYHLQLFPTTGDGPGINLVVRDPRAVAAGFFTVQPAVLGQGNYLLLPDTSYSWRVRTANAAETLAPADPDWGPWSALWTFRTPRTSSASIWPAEPANGAIVSTAPLLRWQDSATWVFYYEVQLSADPEFGTGSRTVLPVYWNLVHGGASALANSWQAPPLEPLRTYYWRVRPRIQGDGAPVAWSGMWTFRTAGPGVAPAPAAPTEAPSPTAAVVTGATGRPDYTIVRENGEYTAISGVTGAIDYRGTDARAVIEATLNSLKSAPDFRSPSTVLNRHIVLEGRGSFQEGWPLSAPLRLPPMQNSVFDARTAVLIGGVEIDSIMDTEVLLGVVGGSVSVAPKTRGPDALTAANMPPTVIDSRVAASSIVGIGEKAGLRFEVSQGSIARTSFDIRNVHGFETLIETTDVVTGFAFQGNVVRVLALYNGTLGVRDGSTAKGGNLENQWNVRFAGNVQRGVETFGHSGFFTVTGDVPFPLRFMPGSRGNTVIGNVPVIDEGENPRHATVLLPQSFGRLE